MLCKAQIVFALDKVEERQVNIIKNIFNKAYHCEYVGNIEELDFFSARFIKEEKEEKLRAAFIVGTYLVNNCEYKVNAPLFGKMIETKDAFYYEIPHYIFVTRNEKGIEVCLTTDAF